jgi:hypothetical protein
MDIIRIEERRENMKNELKYERPKLVELTSNEWNIGYGDTETSEGCVSGDTPNVLVCRAGDQVGK